MVVGSKSDSKDNNSSIELYGDRELVLSKLFDTIDHLYDKAMNGRIRDENKDKIKIQWFKALAYTCHVYSQIKRDIDIEVLNEKIENMTQEIKTIKEAKEHEKRH